jgi:hypothetical protein
LKELSNQHAGKNGDANAHPISWLAKTLHDEPTLIVENESVREKLEGPLIWLACDYLAREKIFFPKTGQAALGRLPKGATIIQLTYALFVFYARRSMTFN